MNPTSDYCSPFDEALATQGPPAVFLVDREGRLRFDPQWTRDAWGRCPEPSRSGRQWIVARDRDSGFVQLVLCTSSDLLADHPRLDLRAFSDRAAAQATVDAFGHPPVVGASSW